jgi:hypothetical protein
METATQYNRNGNIETTGSRRAIASARPNSSNEQVSRCALETYKSLNLCVLLSARIERRTSADIRSNASRHVFSTCHGCSIGWNCFPQDAVFVRRCFDTVLTASEAAHKGGSYANLDAACRRGPANCRGTSLRSLSKRSGPIAFAWSLRPIAEYFGPKARCGGSRHRAGGGLKQDYQQRIAAAAPSDKERIANEAINALAKAVTDQGLSLEEYDSILVVAQNDPEVREKIRQRIRPSAK